MARKYLLGCGVLSSVAYLCADIFGSLRWEGYSVADQTVSELSAIGSPSRELVFWCFAAYNILLIAFASGVALSPGRMNLRRAGNAIAGIGWLGVFGLFFPIHVRGSSTWTSNETMHILLTAITVVFIVGAIVFGAKTAGVRFRAYSIATIAFTLGFGAWSGWLGRAMAEDLPTPWMGVAERLCIYSYLVWIAVFAVVLLRARDESRDRVRFKTAA